jgi:hypothetical protein
VISEEVGKEIAALVCRADVFRFACQLCSLMWGASLILFFLWLLVACALSLSPVLCLLLQVAALGIGGQWVWDPALCLLLQVAALGVPSGGTLVWVPGGVGVGVF